MPSTSKKQHRLMQAAAHNPEFAKKAGVPVSVAKEFNQADKGKKFNRGGNVANLKKLFKGKETYKEELKEGKAIKSGKISPEQYAKGEAMEKKMKKGGKCYAGGGAVKSDELRNADIQREMANQTRVVKKAKGGVTRADGCVTKGHTKGKFV